MLDGRPRGLIKISRSVLEAGVWECKKLPVACCMLSCHELGAYATCPVSVFPKPDAKLAKPSSQA